MRAREKSHTLFQHLSDRGGCGWSCALFFLEGLRALCEGLPRLASLLHSGQPLLLSGPRTVHSLFEEQ